MSMEARDSTRRSGVFVFAFALFVAFAMVTVGWRIQHLVGQSEDPYGYVRMGRSIANGEGFGAYGSVLNRRGPLYPMFIGAVYALFGERPALLQILQAFMQAGIALLAFDIGQRTFNRRTGIIAGIACALHPAFLRYVADFHVETFLTVLFTLTLWSTVRFVERPTIRAAALIGICAGLAALTKPVALPYPFLFAAIWLWQQRRAQTARNRWPLAAAICAAALLVVLPWTYRNYRSSGHIVLVTTGVGDAFLRGYIFSKPEYATLSRPPYTDAEQESNAYFKSLCKQAGTVWERNDVESEQILTREAKRRLGEDFGGFTRKSVTGLFTFWYQMTSFTNSLVVGGTALVSWAFALIGWRRARRERRSSWPLFLPILYLNVMLALLLALGRYSVPILPALTILAAFGVDTMLSPRGAPANQAAQPAPHPQPV